ncbi:MAG: hypothetical protein Q3996_01170 [Candidatus Saccharibacteria bacterium]|nr:hypothetical protein [Candidatus Saccharibacteria bacterium]
MKRMISKFYIALLLIFFFKIMIINQANAALAEPDPIGDEIYQFIKSKSINIVQLGDSYSAGNGASGYELYPTWCHRNNQNWGSQFVQMLRERGVAVNYMNYACSGAKIEHLFSSQWSDGKIYSHYINSDRKLTPEEAAAKIPNLCWNGKPKYERHKMANTSYWVEASRGRQSVKKLKNLTRNKVEYTCSTEVALQSSINNIGTADLILMTLGGNDLNFGKLVEKCFVQIPNVRDINNCNKLIASTKRYIKGKRTKEDEGLFDGKTYEQYYYDKLDELIKKLKPDAKLILAGYPPIIDGTHPLPDIKQNIQIVREYQVKLNGLQSRIVNRLQQKYPNRVQFIGQILEHFQGHSPHVLTFNIFFDRNRDSWLHDSLSLGLSAKWKLFHPNPTGHAEYAKAVANNQSLIKIDELTLNQYPIDVMLMVDTKSNYRAALESVKLIIKRFTNDDVLKNANLRFGLVAIKPDGTAAQILAPTTDKRMLFNKIKDLKLMNHPIVEHSWHSLAEAVDGVLNTDWRNGVRKIAFLVTDGRYSYLDTKNGINFDEYVQLAHRKAYELDPVEFYVIDTDGQSSESLNKLINNESRAILINNNCNDDDDCWSASNLEWQIDESVMRNLFAKPFVKLDGGEKILGTIGQTIRFDAGASYSIDNDDPIVKYYWDFNDDGNYDLETVEPYTEYNFSQQFDGFVAVKAETNSGQSNIATLKVNIQRDLDDIPDKLDNCPDVTNQDQLDYNFDGIGDACDPKKPTDEIELQKWLLAVALSHQINDEITELINQGYSEEAAERMFFEKNPEIAADLDISSIQNKIKNDNDSMSNNNVKQTLSDNTQPKKTDINSDQQLSSTSTLLAKLSPRDDPIADTNLGSIISHDKSSQGPSNHQSWKMIVAIVGFIIVGCGVIYRKLVK